MFTHYNNPGKCEWRGGALNAFVRHYNESAGSAYALTKCLDIVRISGTTRKEPEVLLTDTINGKQMVIERKSVVWPESYIHQHELGHEFASLIWNGSGVQFHDAGYKLFVRAGELRSLTSKQIREAGEKIGEMVSKLTKADLPFRSAQPIGWSFRGIEPGEEEDDLKGIVVSEFGSMGLDSSDREEAIEGVPAKIQEQLEAAAAKFRGYERHLRLVLLDFYSEDLWEDDIPPMMENILIPQSVDEIWRTVRDWVSPDDYEIGYDALFKRLP